MMHRRPKTAQEHLLRLQRQQLTDQIRARYARFGDEVCQTILNAALQPGGMQRLIAQLKLPPTPLFGEQLERISRYLSGMGGAELVRAVRLAAAKPSVDLVNPFDQAPEAGAGPGAVNENKSTQEEPPAIIESGAYTGPERRSGKDRREMADRRLNVDAIGRNKRFGGNRRKSGGRRKTDR